MFYLDIAKAHDIKKVRVIKNKLIINDEFFYFYKYDTVAQAVAKKLRNFINI